MRRAVVFRRATALRLLCAVAVTSVIAGCDRSPSAGSARGATAADTIAPLFDRLAADSTGIAFTNPLPEAQDFNILNYLYYFNGGGVAVGDVNGDGLQDLYFSANLERNRLYLNRGGFRFEDVTDRAGVGGPSGWKTGVTMADVNGDGKLDIYVSTVSYLSKQGRNALYLNNGDGTFTDRADAMGLAHVGYSTQASFFDYDGDGDLDMFLLSHSTHTERAIGAATKRDVRNARAGGRLYRNDGARFTDVSAVAGIFGGIEGYGLGLVVSDLNLDGCPDVYVANDFQEQDFLYENDCRGHFTESIAKATGHTSRFSMGVDAADVNNDGLPDIVVGDMLPEREEILKSSASSESYSLFNLRVRAGYHPQYARNTLQLNRGAGKFSDVAFLSRVEATDWTWALLFADLDDDGRKDLFATSGIFRRPNDLDYINYVGNETIQASLASGVSRENMSLLRQMPTVPVPNHIFRNDGGLQFTDVATPWGLTESGYSNGAAYVDLDNDGALDLVINNYNAPAAIYRNRGRARTGHASLTVALAGDGRNTAGIGAKVTVVQRGVRQYVEASPTRGFQSSMDPRLHIGLGRDSLIDSLIVVWPDRRFQILTGVTGNRTLTLSQRDAAGRWSYDGTPRTPLFRNVTDSISVDYIHVENDFNDMDREQLMPHLLSAEGPALAVGDVNGDGLDDIYAGGAKWQPGKLLLQQRNGQFAESAAAVFVADSVAEDVDAIFFDANGDRHPDLYVVSGGNELWGAMEPLRDRLYLNDGAGHFTKAVGALPVFGENGACVVAGDYDGDGDLDLFVGTRVIAKQYGMPPASHLLRNDGGRFTDVTATVAPALQSAGMATSAAWVDTDRDGSLELVVAGEWMPVRVFRQRRGVFADVSRESGLAGTEGWWTSLAVTDVNGDSIPDLVLGNLGLNSYLRASQSEPAEMYVHDFGGNGSLKQIITFYKGGVSYPLATRDELIKVIPALKSKFPTYKSFGASTVSQIFPASDLAAATRLRVNTFATSVAVGGAGGRFTMTALPVEAQFAPVFAIQARDMDGDGHVDLLLAGNRHGAPPMLGRADASYGVLLRGNGAGAFAALDLPTSGIVIEGEARKVALVRRPSGPPLVAVARNNARLQFFRPSR